MAGKTANSIHKKIKKEDNKSSFLKKQLDNYFLQLKNNYLKSVSNFFKTTEVVDQIVSQFQSNIEDMDHEEINDRACIISMRVFSEAIIQFCNSSKNDASKLLETLDADEEDDILSES